MEFSAYPDAGAGQVGMEAEYSIAFDFYAAFQRTHAVYVLDSVRGSLSFVYRSWSLSEARPKTVVAQPRAAPAPLEGG